MAEISLSLSNPKAVVEAGERIYKEKYQRDFEAAHLGKFAVIEVKTGKAYLGDTPEDAFENGRKGAPEGVFHLIKVGSPGAYRVSYAGSASDWLFQ
jgi:hypothetical protein